MVTSFENTGSINTKAIKIWPRIRKVILIQEVMCVIPTILLLFNGIVLVSAFWFFSTFFIFQVINLYKKEFWGFSALLIGVIPIIMVLRQFLFHNIVLVLCVIAALLPLLKISNGRIRLLHEKKFNLLFISCLIYWILSFINSGYYSTNLGVLELFFASYCLYNLSNKRLWFITTLWCYSISTLAIAIAFLPYGDRLGAVYIGDYFLGNPASIGLPLTLVFFLSIIDQGKWLDISMNKPLKNILLLSSFTLIVLSTSRISWLVTIVGISLFFITGSPKVKLKLIIIIIFLSSLFFLLLQTQQGQFISNWFNKIILAESYNEFLFKVTTGRSSQWELFPDMIYDSPLIGYGPGNSRTIFHNYAVNDLRIMTHQINLQIHGFFLQISIEMGLIGLFIIIVFLLHIVKQSYLFWKKTNNFISLVAILSFITIGLSISGFNAIVGVYLGLGFMGFHPQDHKYKKSIKVPLIKSLM